MTAPELRAALKSLHLSQRSLAERLGVDPTTVNRWAVGKAPVPQYAAYVLELLAEREGIGFVGISLPASMWLKAVRGDL
jgi:transcriptional regulator with XRE-family HTH domain